MQRKRKPSHRPTKHPRARQAPPCQPVQGGDLVGPTEQIAEGSREDIDEALRRQQKPSKMR